MVCTNAGDVSADYWVQKVLKERFSNDTAHHIKRCLSVNIKCGVCTLIMKGNILK